MQSTCPHSFLPPLQVGLSVTLAHKYGHRNLVDKVNKFEFCNHTRCSATKQGVDISSDITDVFLQYQADNIDHANKTLDGNDTIHVMDQMATFTPGIKAVWKVPMQCKGEHGRPKEDWPCQTLSTEEPK